MFPLTALARSPHEVCVVNKTSRSVKGYALALAGAALVWCAGCTPGFFDAPPETPPSLQFGRIPPTTAALDERGAPYTEVSPLHFAGWHPVNREMLIAKRIGETLQLHRLAEPGGALRQLTSNSGAVGNASYQPWRGNYLIYATTAGGGEAPRLDRLNVNTRETIALLDAPRSAARAEWSHVGDRLVATTVLPGKPGDPESAATELYLLDPSQRETARPLVTLPGGGWDEFAWSPDDTRLVAIQNVTAQASRVWLIDARSGNKTLLLPDSADDKPVIYAHPNFLRDGKGLILTTDRASEYRQLTYYHSAKREFEYWTAALQANVEEVALSPDGKLVAITANENGRRSLHLFSAASHEELPLAALPDGSVSELHWHSNNADLGFRIESARSTSYIYALDVKTSHLERWASASADH